MRRIFLTLASVSFFASNSCAEERSSSYRQTPLPGTNHNDDLTSVDPVGDEIRQPENDAIDQVEDLTPLDGDTEDADYNPYSGLVFQYFDAMNPRNDAPRGSKLEDIVQHLPTSFGNTYYDRDMITWGHETSHAIHAHIRNSLIRSSGTNGFYVLEGRYIALKEPKMRKSKVAEFVPSSLKGNRYNTYVTGQTSWDDRPLYIWDEWNAYVNGGEVGVELVEKGLWGSTWRDGVAGQLEFNHYAIATAMAIAKYDPEYFDSNPDFMKFLAYNLERSMKWFYAGYKYPQFVWAAQEQQLGNFLTGQDTASMRQFIVNAFGKSWCQRIFGEGSW